MQIWEIMARVIAKHSAGRSNRRRPGVGSRLGMDRIEALEERVVLYAATGNAWPTPQVVTISFMPDGTNLGGVKSNLNSAFNGNSAIAAKWKTEILRAAQVWAQATNINFVVIDDSGVASGGGNYQQGDPTMGDIRIGGFNFGNSSLARAYAPPPANNYSIAGDITFNTGISFSVGNGYDLFTVAAHEFGHALGLDHTSASSASEMWSTYNGLKPSLSEDDLAGIRNIYSANAPRDVDAYDAAGSNGTFATASVITSAINSKSKDGVVQDLDITTTSDVDFYKFVAPAGSKNAMKITVQSSGLSLLSPTITIYAADQKTVLGSASGLNKYGTALTVKVTGVDDGDTYYIKVQGADSSAFSTGEYALVINCGGGADPEVVTPSNPVAKGAVLTSSGGVAQGDGANDDFLSNATVITNISPDSGGSFSDRVTNTRNFSVTGAAPIGYKVELFRDGVSVGTAGAVGNLLGSLLSVNLSLNTWTITPSQVPADGVYTFVAKATSLLGLVQGYSDTFTVRVDTQAPAAPLISEIEPTNGILVGSTTNGNQVTLTGTAEINSAVTVLANGVAIGATMTDGQGNWSFTTSTPLSDRTHVFTAKAADLAGNQSAASAGLSLTVDTTPPPAPKVTAATLTTANGQTYWTISGTANQAAAVEVLINGISLGTTTVATDGSWTYKYTPSANVPRGTYKFTARSKDIVQNTSVLSPEFSKAV